MQQNLISFSANRGGVKGILLFAKAKSSKNFCKDFLFFCQIRALHESTIEVMAVWLCTAFCPLQGNKTWSLLTKQGVRRRVNCIPQNKLKKNAMHKLHTNMLHKLCPTSCVSLKCPAQ